MEHTSMISLGRVLEHRVLFTFTHAHSNESFQTKFSYCLGGKKVHIAFSFESVPGFDKNQLKSQYSLN